MKRIKYLFWLLIFSFILTNIWYIKADYIRWIWYDYLFDFSVNITNFGAIDYYWTTNWNFSINSNLIDYNNFLYFPYVKSRWNEKYLVIWRKNNKLYWFIKTNSSSNQYSNVNIQWYFDKFAILDSEYDFDPFDWTNNTAYQLIQDINTIINLLNNVNIIWFHGSNHNDYANFNNANWRFMFFSTNYISDFCLITDDNSNKYICFRHSSLTTNQPDYNNNFIDSENFNVIDWNSPSSWNWFFDNSPIIWWWDWDWWNESWWIEIWSNQSAIQYFENSYWRNKNICYVWVDNLTDMYWTNGVAFQQWTWLSIFDVYEWLYWNRDLNKVYVWLNSWLLNYEEWFRTWWNPPYLSRYNSWTNQVDVYYNNLTFPFANNPVAIYFMASNIDDQMPYSTMWSEIVSYCNIKINDWTFDDIISDVVKWNIDTYTKQSNKSKWLNLDWTPKVFTGPFLSLWWTGYENDHWGSSTGDTDLKSFFDNAMDEMQSVWERWVQNPFTWILPNWLIYSFIIVVLFKLLRK